ncbi:MAG: DUF4258 domain-containing protein [Planctomycetota bacterium]
MACRRVQGERRKQRVGSLQVVGLGNRVELHLLKRMIDRSFSEVDVRLMMESADEVIRAVEPGRIISRFAGRPWEVIVEPDEHDQLLVVVTAYPVSTR